MFERRTLFQQLNFNMYSFKRPFLLDTILCAGVHMLVDTMALGSIVVEVAPHAASVYFSKWVRAGFGSLILADICTTNDRNVSTV
jgi:hypothetical protein